MRGNINKIYNNLAKVISATTSPVLVIAIFSLITIYYNTSNLSEFIFWGIVFLVLIDIIPASFIAYQVYRGRYSDLHLATREQRHTPFALAVMGAFIVFAMTLLLLAPMELVITALAIFINGLIIAIITRFWKISMHAATFVSSVLIVSMFVDLKYLWFLILLLPIGWARVYRRRHTLSQVLAGSIVSAGLTVLIINLLR